jgi:hypothetical protein
VVVAGALGLTLLGWLFSPSSAAAAQLLPPVSVPTLAVPGVATVTPGTPALPSVDVSPVLVDVPLRAQAAPSSTAPSTAPSPSLSAPVVSSAQASVPAVLGAVRSVSETVTRLPVAAVVATRLRDVTGLVESMIGAAIPETAPGVAAPCSRKQVTSQARHDVGSARTASINALSSPQPTSTVPVSTRQPRPSPSHGPAFPVPTPLNSSCVSSGHGGVPTAVILAADHPTGPVAGPVQFGADQVGGDDNAASPGVTPD